MLKKSKKLVAKAFDFISHTYSLKILSKFIEHLSVMIQFLADIMQTWRTTAVSYK